MGVQPGESRGFSIWEDGSNEGWGTERFTIAPGGNVGIGTLIPGESLEVRGNVRLGNTFITGIRALTPTYWGYSRSYPVLLLGPASGVGTVSIGYDPSGNPNGSFGGEGREVLFRNGTKFVTPNAENNAFYLNQIVLNDGNVGIGKTPNSLLDVAGTGTFQIPGGEDALDLRSNTPGPINIRIAPSGATDHAARIRGTQNGGDTDISVLTGGVERLIIDKTGNVGINKPSPTKALDVVGDANISGKITGATFGFGGMYTIAAERPSSSRKNPITGTFSCPSGFASYELLATRDPDTYHEVVYICVK